jgi:hypothetical protein
MAYLWLFIATVEALSLLRGLAICWRPFNLKCKSHENLFNMFYQSSITGCLRLLTQ